MNCFNHPEEAAVASCLDCGKGLCKECASLYQMPICNDCNLKRVKNDKSNIIKVYAPSIVLFLIGIPFGVYSVAPEDASIFVKIGFGIISGYFYAAIPWGWKAITFLQPKMFLFLSFMGWFIYFLIKFILSVFVGLVALPLGLIKLIVNMISARKKEENIVKNLSYNQ